MEGVSEPKAKILELLWRVENPLGLREVSDRTGLKARSVNMHLFGLVSLGYASKSEGGSYTITESGKEAIGFPKVDVKFAEKVLSNMPQEKVFHFYSGIGQPAGISSSSLVDFCDKVKTADVKSVEFHMTRGDFERWVHSLGDVELAKRLRLIREEGPKGEALRERLHGALRSRCDRLLKETC